MFRTLNLAFPCSSVETDRPLLHACEWIFNWVMMQQAIRTETFVVTDIDDTLLDREQRALPDVVDLVKRIAENNIKVYFVTARMHSEKFMDKTRKHLNDIGIGQDIVRDRLFMMPPELYRLGDAEVVAKYKYDVRRSLCRGRYLGANLGDQMTDFVTPRHRIASKHVESMQHWRRPLVFVEPVEKTACLKIPRPL